MVQFYQLPKLQLVTWMILILIAIGCNESNDDDDDVPIPPDVVSTITDAEGNYRNFINEITKGTDEFKIREGLESSFEIGTFLRDEKLEFQPQNIDPELSNPEIFSD